jgi:hypothetical protein
MRKQKLMKRKLKVRKSQWEHVKIVPSNPKKLKPMNVELFLYLILY